MSNIPRKRSIVSLASFLVTMGFSVITPLLLFAITLGVTLLIPGLVIDTTFLTIYFLIMCTVYNAILLFTISFGKQEQGEDVAHYFSIILPAHNEESVIEETLRHVFKIKYPSELFEVIVVNDGSTDNTESVVRNFQKKHPNLKLINVLPKNGGLGKGTALNVGFSDFLLTWRGLEIEPRHRWIIGVFDADGHPHADMLKKVSFEFKDPRVGGVQTLVRIRNRKKSFLAKLQDMEFISFSRVMQLSRTIFKGDVALGGNGQFIRATALDTVALIQTKEYWNVKSLTEDLDIGLRLSIKKWEMRYVGSTAVDQEGVETLHSLIRQRERWSWGTLQALKHYVLNFKVWKSRISLTKKIDTSIHLFTIIIPLLVTLCWIWSGMSYFGLISISNIFPFAFIMANAFSFVPFYFYGLWKERTEYPLWQILPLTLIATVYTYHWIICLSSAIIKAITQKPIWVKTPRSKCNNSDRFTKSPYPRS
ncbi:MAG: glycosyltransferase [Promethearchaeota archaeon]|jgi:cellulose synthase/poly-beta-1,6-N-acetylglucosamine synthase-like glycosyltransferase